jgi:hypothetical protein
MFPHQTLIGAYYAIYKNGYWGMLNYMRHIHRSRFCVKQQALNADTNIHMALIMQKYDTKKSR